MNIVVVADSAFISGGMQKCAIWSAIELAGRGHRVTYLAGYGPVDPAFEENPGVEVVCAGYEERPARLNRGDAIKRVFGNAELGEMMKAVLEGLPTDDTIVHCHDVDRIVSMRPLEVALKRGFPVVMTLHTYGLSCPSGSFFNFAKVQQCPLRPMSLACLCTECTAHGPVTKAGHVAKFMVNRYRSGIPAKLRHIVCVSEFSKRINLPYMHRDADVRVIPNHVDLMPGPRVKAEQNRAFTYVGRLVPEKAPVLLARAARELGVPVKFVGDGAEKERVMEANPDAAITGWVSPEGVHRELAQARALCMVSGWYEGLPLVVGEALSKGLPIIVSDACAAQESIVDGETGLLFRSGDVDDLARKMRALLDDDACRRMSEVAYSRFWEAPVTLERHVDQLEGLYREMLMGARTPAKATA